MVLDRARGIYTDPALVRPINHDGRFFNVPGPHITQPSPQRTPLLLQAGASRAGKQFAAQHAEAIFVSAHAPAVCAKNVAEIRALAESGYGRNGKDIKVLALVTPILGRTEEEAQAKLADYRQYASLEGALALFGGWTGIDLGQYGDEQELRQVESNAVRSTVEGYARFSPGTAKWTKHTIAEHVSIGGNGPVLVGTAEQVADGLETWVREAYVDGFSFVSCHSGCLMNTVADLARPMFSFPSPSRTSLSCCCPSCASAASSGTTTPYRRAHTARTSTDVRARSSLWTSMSRRLTCGRRAYQQRRLSSRQSPRRQK